MRWTCYHCGHVPARGWLPESGRFLCGVCWHRLLVLQDLAYRVRTWQEARA